jgi:hypothetical protein
MASKKKVTPASMAARCQTRRQPPARSVRAASMIITGSNRMDAYFVALASSNIPGMSTSHLAVPADLAAQYAANAISIRASASKVA